MATTQRAILATLAAAALWGTSFPVNDAGLAYVGPAAFAAARFVMAGIVALAALAALRKLETRLPRQRAIWLLAAANGLAFLLQYVAQTHTTPARTALFVNSSAFAVALMERILFGARLGPWRVGAIVAGVAGATLLIAGSDPRGLEGGQPLGDLLALAAGLVWAVYFVFTKRRVADEDPVALTGWTFALTGVLLLPFALFDPRPLPSAPEGWAAVAYAGIVTTALAFGLWAYGLKRIRASTSAVLLLVEILVASLLSFAIGRESFGWIDLAGAALLCAALVVMSVTESAGGETAAAAM